MSMENKDITQGVDLWIARNKNESLFLFVEEKPYKEGDWWEIFSYQYFTMDNSLFPEVQWSDEEPTRVRLVIEDKK